MRKRRAFISFPEQHGSDSNLLASQKVLDGLNIRFNVKIYSQMGIPAEAYISIYNLNREDMQFLTTSAATWLAQQSLIQLYAGYDNDVRCLFSGQIMDAPPEGYPDFPAFKPPQQWYSLRTKPQAVLPLFVLLQQVALFYAINIIPLHKICNSFRLHFFQFHFFHSAFWDSVCIFTTIFTNQTL